MISFTLGIILLVLGYFTYGRLVERIVKPDDNAVMPAYSKQDGVDYVPMKEWRIYMIQFLNIAGMGPVFGAVMGAKFGVASYLWIVLGTLFAGAVHDFCSGMMSLRNGGCNLPMLHGMYLGKGMQRFSVIFTVIMMLLTTTVFVTAPAGLLAKMTPNTINILGWTIVILLYYVLATMFPVDKIIGKIYPVFAALLLFMGVGICVAMFINHPQLPELFDGLQNTHPAGNAMPIFPMMFISIACGALSGFHATQSPMMARCMTHERQGRRIFYGAMVTEGILALIWAAAATAYYKANGMAENDSASIVAFISNSWLGTVGGILAVLGVISASVTTGDTALRSARIIVADRLSIDQKPLLKRLMVTFPLVLLLVCFLAYMLNDSDGFNRLWRYFACANQLLGTITLWSVAIWLYRKGSVCHWIALLPAVFMTMVVLTYIVVAPECFNLMAYRNWAMMGSALVAIVLVRLYLNYFKNKAYV